MTRFPRLFVMLTGLALPYRQAADLKAALAEQVKRGGRGSQLAAAQLKGLCAAELRSTR